MKVDMQMPQMGESIAEGTILKWHKAVGDKIEKDEILLEISTDKVDSEIPATESGILTEILAQEGETVTVGSKIAVIETDAGAAAAATPAAQVQPQPKVEAPKVEPHTPKENKTEPAPVASSANGGTTGGGNGNLVDMVMPQMGESIAEGTILKWHKAVGDKIEKDEIVLEISTDKVDSEIPATTAGVLAEILAPEGETVTVGATIAKISVGGAAPAATSAKAATPTPTPQPQPVKQTDGVGQPQPVARQAVATQPAATTTVTTAPGVIPARVGNQFFSPLVRTIAAKEGLSLPELQQIEGTGVNNRVSKKDILAYLENRPAVRPAATPTAAAAQQMAKQPPAPVQYAYQQDRVEVIPMNNMRKSIMEHMRRSLDSSAHVYTMTEADMTNIVRFREKNKKAFLEKYGFKLTYTPFIAAASARALRDFPMVNVSIDGTNIIKKNYINIGIAVALDNYGLIVPVIKDADEKNLLGIARAVSDLAGRARTKKLTIDETQDGTFSITNMGVFGSLIGFPVINQPQTAILGVGAIQKRPVVVTTEYGDHIVVRSMLYISLSYDHRVVDGALGGEFLERVAYYLTNFDESSAQL